MHKLIPILLLAACATTEPAPEPMPDHGPPPEAHRMQPGHLPTPFSADQIRAACSEGAFRQFTVTDKDRVQHMRMVFGPDEDGMVSVSTELLDDTGAVATTMPGQPTAWTTLQSHASFPAEATELTVVEDQPAAAGRFDGWTYVVTGSDGSIRSLTFARDLPGPPILMTVWQGGFELSRMELVDYGPR